MLGNLSNLDIFSHFGILSNIGDFVLYLSQQTTAYKARQKNCPCGKGLFKYRMIIFGPHLDPPL